MSKQIKTPREPPKILDLQYDINNKFEICIDEVGRGCLFGRAYISAVVLPKDGSFIGKDIKDSKKFSSKKKIKEVAEYIKNNTLIWHTEYVDATMIDELNILQAVMKGMHSCIKNVILKLKEKGFIGDNIQLEPIYKNEIMAIIDGNYFIPYRWFDNKKECITEIPAVTIEQGDAKHMGIAAASILAKVTRDEYIDDLCNRYPILTEYYALNKNVGYGTKLHLDGIKIHGITNLHRRSFGICKTIAPSIQIDETIKEEIIYDKIQLHSSL
jgi:ribonuclease HII